MPGPGTGQAAACWTGFVPKRIACGRVAEHAGRIDSTNRALHRARLRTGNQHAIGHPVEGSREGLPGLLQPGFRVPPLRACLRSSEPLFRT